MTRKDYEAIAKVIRNNVNSEESFNLMREFTRDLCEVFEADNSRFDIVRFMQTCGFNREIYSSK